MIPHPNLPEDEREHAGLMTDAYGDAGALDILGGRYGLPLAPSAHNNYFYWGPPDAQVVIAVAWSGRRLERVFGEVEAIARSLLAVLPKDDIAERVIVTDEVALEYYRLDKISQGSLVLEPGAHTVDPITEAGMRREKEEKAALSEIINVLNDRFGTDFDDADRLFFDQIEEELVTDESLSHQARNNTLENFKFGFEDKFTTAVIDRMEQNQDIFTRLMDNDDFRDVVVDLMLKRVYGRLRRETFRDQ